MLDFRKGQIIHDPRDAVKDAEELCHGMIRDIFRGAYSDPVLGRVFGSGKAILIYLNEETGWPQLAILEPGNDDGDKH